MLYKFGILLAQYLLATTAHNSNDKHKTVCRAGMDTHDIGISSIFYRKRISFYPCIYGAFLFLPHLSQCTNPYSICSDPTYETWKVIHIGSSHIDQFHHVRQGTVLILMGRIDFKLLVHWIAKKDSACFLSNFCKKNSQIHGLQHHLECRNFSSPTFYKPFFLFCDLQNTLSTY